VQRHELGLPDEILFKQLGLVGDLLGHDVKLFAQALVLPIDGRDFLLKLADAAAKYRLAFRQPRRWTSNWAVWLARNA
jgi:hypothetical protein